MSYFTNTDVKSFRSCCLDIFTMSPSQLLFRILFISGDPSLYRFLFYQRYQHRPACILLVTGRVADMWLFVFITTAKKFLFIFGKHLLNTYFIKILKCCYLAFLFYLQQLKSFSLYLEKIPLSNYFIEILECWYVMFLFLLTTVKMFLFIFGKHI